MQISSCLDCGSKDNFKEVEFEFMGTHLLTLNGVEKCFHLLNSMNKWRNLA